MLLVVSWGTVCARRLCFARRVLLCVHRALLDQGGDVNRRDRGSWTALMYAVCGQHIPAIQLLLSAPDIKVNARNVNGWAAVHWAVGGRRGRDNPEILGMLVGATVCEPSACCHSQLRATAHPDHASL
jgi:hypothetical protein